jgi:hypothetical protein
MRWLVLVSLAACDGSTTAIDLELLPSPELSSERDLADRIRTVVVVVDAAQGRLYPLDAEQLGGTVQIKNADADAGDLELVALVPVPSGRLPRIRIERGGLPDVALHIRVLGTASGEQGIEMARGGVTGVTFDDGDTKVIPTPFNLLPRWLPLRVTEVAPSDGQVIPCDSHLDILTVFSRSVAPASITAPGGIVVEETGTGEVAPVELRVNGSIATFVAARALVDYRVTLSTDVVDTDGVALDQVPSMAGLQPYRGDFHLECSGAMTPVNNWCSPQMPTAPCPGPPGRFRCDAGQCVPNSCTGAACTAGFVCDPSTFLCVPDCDYCD